jgi:hypothetical protein
MGVNLHEHMHKCGEEELKKKISIYKVIFTSGKTGKNDKNLPRLKPDN